MINRIFKNIHNRFSKFFKYFFFLRYIISIFLISVFLFLLIPKFFNYEKKHDFIKEYLVNDYGIEVKNFNTIKFYIFPIPNLKIKNVDLKIKGEPIKLNTDNLIIFLSLKSIYNFNNFKANKIILNDSDLEIEIGKLIKIINHTNKFKSKFSIKNLNLNLINKEKNILKINKANYSNYGYNKDKIYGEFFGKKFKLLVDQKNRNLIFEIINTGIKANINFEKEKYNNLSAGRSKINILNNYFKINYLFKNNLLNIFKSDFRNKNITMAFESLISFSPFFEAETNLHIKKVDKEFIYNFDLEKIINNKLLLKRLNNKNKIIYNNKLKRDDIFKSHILNIDLAYGRLNFLSNTSFSGGEVNCKADSTLIDEYPRLIFSCFFKFKDINKFSKQYSLNKKFEKDTLNLSVTGSINLLNKKISFKKIIIDETKTMNEEDLQFYKESFENILFNKSFFKIFKKEKIKDYLIAII